MSLLRLKRLENRLERRSRIARIPLVRLKDRENPLDFYNSEQFKKRYHMFKETAIFITGLIYEDLTSPLKRGCQLPPVLQFLVVARFLATGSFQIVGDLSNLSQGTISNLITRVATVIAKLYKKYIYFPNKSQAVEIREKFYSIAKFPGVTGAIACVHVQINSPGGPDAELFRNRKTKFSINVQAVCDPDLNFTNVVCRWYGSAHDTRIFDNSRLMADLESGTSPGILLGDNGYTLLPFVMTPLLNPITVPEKRYNKAQISIRNTIERSFGILKRKFLCLNHLRLKLKSCLTVIVATMVLHNITRRRRDIFEDDDDMMMTTPDG